MFRFFVSLVLVCSLAGSGAADNVTRAVVVQVVARTASDVASGTARTALPATAPAEYSGGVWDAAYHCTRDKRGRWQCTIACRSTLVARCPERLAARDAVAALGRDSAVAQLLAGQEREAAVYVRLIDPRLDAGWRRYLLDSLAALERQWADRHRELVAAQARYRDEECRAWPDCELGDAPASFWGLAGDQAQANLVDAPRRLARAVTQYLADAGERSRRLRERALRDGRPIGGLGAELAVLGVDSARQTSESLRSASEHLYQAMLDERAAGERWLSAAKAIGELGLAGLSAADLAGPLAGVSRALRASAGRGGPRVALAGGGSATAAAVLPDPIAPRPLATTGGARRAPRESFAQGARRLQRRADEKGLDATAARDLALRELAVPPGTALEMRAEYMRLINARIDAWVTTPEAIAVPVLDEATLSLRRARGSIDASAAMKHEIDQWAALERSIEAFTQGRDVPLQVFRRQLEGRIADARPRLASPDLSDAEKITDAAALGHLAVVYAEVTWRMGEKIPRDVAAYLDVRPAIERITGTARSSIDAGGGLADQIAWWRELDAWADFADLDPTARADLHALGQTYTDLGITSAIRVEKARAEATRAGFARIPNVRRMSARSAPAQLPAAPEAPAHETLAQAAARLQREHPRPESSIPALRAAGVRLPEAPRTRTGIMAEYRRIYVARIQSMHHAIGTGQRPSQTILNGGARELAEARATYLVGESAEDMARLDELAKVDGIVRDMVAGKPVDMQQALHVIEAERLQLSVYMDMILKTLPQTTGKRQLADAYMTAATAYGHLGLVRRILLTRHGIHVTDEVVKDLIVEPKINVIVEFSILSMPTHEGARALSHAERYSRYWQRVREWTVQHCSPEVQADVDGLADLFDTMMRKATEPSGEAN